MRGSLRAGQTSQEITDVENSNSRSDCTVRCCIPTCLRTNSFSFFSSPERLSARDWNKLTDLRIDLVKAALQLTPEQTKLWPPVETLFVPERRTGRPVCKIQNNG